MDVLREGGCGWFIHLALPRDSYMKIRAKEVGVLSEDAGVTAGILVMGQVYETRGDVGGSVINYTFNHDTSNPHHLTEYWEYV
jgi:hypothetical protein